MVGATKTNPGNERRQSAQQGKIFVVENAHTSADPGVDLADPSASRASQPTNHGLIVGKTPWLN